PRDEREQRAQRRKYQTIRSVEQDDQQDAPEGPRNGETKVARRIDEWTTCAPTSQRVEPPRHPGNAHQERRSEGRGVDTWQHQVDDPSGRGRKPTPTPDIESLAREETSDDHGGLD